MNKTTLCCALCLYLKSILVEKLIMCYATGISIYYLWGIERTRPKVFSLKELELNLNLCNTNQTSNYSMLGPNDFIRGKHFQNIPPFSDNSVMSQHSLKLHRKTVSTDTENIN